MPEIFNFDSSLKDAILAKMVDVAVSSLQAFPDKFIKKKPVTIPIDKFEERIFSHFNELYNWSKEIEFVGLGKPITTEKTIQLNYYFSRRRNTDLDTNQRFSESDIINSSENVIIEGDLGSGKSTTLKRILSDYFFSPSPKECSFLYPVLIRFRAFKSSDNLYTYLCNLLGINYQTEIEQYKIEVSKTRAVVIQGKERHEQYKEIEIRERIKYLIDDLPIDKAVGDILEKK